MNKRVKFSYIILLLIFMSSCHTEQNTVFYMQNNLSDSIRIDTDTSLSLEPVFIVGNERRIFGIVEENRGNTIESFLDILRTVVITNLGNSKQSTTDFSVLDEWVYEKISEDTDSYTLIIDEDDF